MALYRVISNDTFGTHIVATQDIPKGTTVMEDAPVFSFNIRGDVCFECSLPGVLDPCRSAATLIGCQGHNNICGLKFCSSKCYKKAWTTFHCKQDPERLAATIKFVKKGYSSSRTFVVAMSKLAAMQLLPEANKDTLDFLKRLAPRPKRVDHSMHVAVEQLDGWTGIVNNVVPSASTLVTREWTRAHVNLISTYAFGDLSSLSIRGLSNFFNHSCVPNVRVATHVDMFTLLKKRLSGAGTFTSTYVATSDMKAGEQLFISYCQHKYPNAVRAAFLKMQYGFDCTCELCSSVGDALHQPTCDGCGVAESELTAKLKTCTACKDALYCSVKCQRLDWKEHKVYCKRRRAARLSFLEDHPDACGDLDPITFFSFRHQLKREQSNNKATASAGDSIKKEVTV